MCQWLQAPGSSVRVLTGKCILIPSCQSIGQARRCSWNSAWTDHKRKSCHNRKIKWSPSSRGKTVTFITYRRKLPNYKIPPLVWCNTCHLSVFRLCTQDAHRLCPLRKTANCKSRHPLWHNHIQVPDARSYLLNKPQSNLARSWSPGNRASQSHPKAWPSEAESNPPCQPRSELHAYPFGFSPRPQDDGRSFMLTSSLSNGDIVKLGVRFSACWDVMSIDWRD